MWDLRGLIVCVGSLTQSDYVYMYSIWNLRLGVKQYVSGMFEYSWPELLFRSEFRKSDLGQIHRIWVHERQLNRNSGINIRTYPKRPYMIPNFAQIPFAARFSVDHRNRELHFQVGQRIQASQVGIRLGLTKLNQNSDSPSNSYPRNSVFFCSFAIGEFWEFVL